MEGWKAVAHGIFAVGSSSGVTEARQFHLQILTS